MITKNMEKSVKKRSKKQTIYSHATLKLKINLTEIMNVSTFFQLNLFNLRVALL